MLDFDGEPCVVFAKIIFLHGLMSIAESNEYCQLCIFYIREVLASYEFPYSLLEYFNKNIMQPLGVSQ